MKIVDCHGPPRARGHAHGEALRGIIADALDRWSGATLRDASGSGDIDTYCNRFLSETGLMACVERTAPDLHDEMTGIAEGAGQPLPRIAAYNLMDEQWWFDARYGAPPPGCSLVALPVAGGHVLAQTMDLPGHMDGSQVVLRLGGADMPETVLLSAAGLIGLTGVNAAGVAIGVNTLLMLHHDNGGLPVAFALRQALAGRSRDTARARLAGANHASGQHYAIVSRDGITSVECSAGGCAGVGQGGDGRLLHTNHPLASTDIDAAADTRLDRSGFNRSSHRRLDWLRGKACALHTRADLQAVFDNWQSPLCMHAERNSGSSTFATVLYELSDTPCIRMRKGNREGTDWQDIGFRAATDV